MEVKFVTGLGMAVLTYTAEEGSLSVAEFRKRLSAFMSDTFPRKSFSVAGGDGSGYFVQVAECDTILEG